MILIPFEFIIDKIGAAKDESSLRKKQAAEGKTRKPRDELKAQLHARYDD